MLNTNNTATNKVMPARPDKQRRAADQRIRSGYAGLLLSFAPNGRRAYLAQRSRLVALWQGSLGVSNFVSEGGNRT